MSQEKGGQCFLISLLGMGTVYLIIANDENNNKNKQEDCNDLINWVFALSTWFYIMAAYVALLIFDFKFLNKILIGNVLTLKESLGSILGISSLVMAIGLTYYFESNCNLVSIFTRSFLYIYWGVTSCTYFMICNLFQNLLQSTSSSNSNNNNNNNNNNLNQNLDEYDYQQLLQE
ncbi:hypothetical protein PPERSA_02010 [Pseudocohnilembus persalinus]|uniref:Uncharacterized protein n=1 Tax=Pseudocohnilembus persalinus TaxID=266149 RepID=A0A0V0QF62_PSEPJ|nr:hypothetical protein PPERSA_02010 [Pseudocohnilembus persalinus]|eukprot:KRX00831.1 hypothetical protein PPERSA_02010 [Pseudocohnilembus persalinus]